MSRPSKAESVELERLEVASGMLAHALEVGGIVAIRLRQVQRRAPALHELIVAGQGQLTAMVDAMDEAYGLLHEVLSDKYAQRHKAHFGGESDG